MDGTQQARRWVILAVGMTAMVSACAFQYGLPFLIPAFRASGFTLAEAGVLISAPVAGVLLSLVLWGALADRFGERLVMLIGLTGAALTLAAASTVHDPVALGALLVLAGATGACVNVASGRLILGWFAVHERGLAMGLRQTAQPLGVALAAVTLPRLGADGPGPALVFLAAGCALSAALVFAAVHDGTTAAMAGERSGSPYRGPYLWRVHAASALLVVPQFTVAAFAFDFLVSDRGWAPGTAGPVLAGAHLGGAGMRLFAGWWSDRAGSRLRPMRLLAVGTAAVLAVLAAGAWSGSSLAAVALAVAAVLSVSTNGLSFTAVAERAGRSWAGRALGVQNTAQNAVAALTPPAVAAVVTAGSGAGYATAFGGIVAFPLLAALLVPVSGERAVA